MVLFGKTDIGKVRSSNQDVYCIKTFDKNASLGIVCDGMGGENGGQIASAVASRAIFETIQKRYKPGLADDEYKNIVITALSDGNVAVYEKAKEDPESYKGMGTTAVIALVVNNKAYIAHVGDSRIYLIREDEIFQLTKDHSMVQMLMDQGKITKEEAEHHPKKNMITRAVGVGKFVDIDYIQVSNLDNCSLLLCSDGLTNTCSDECIKEVLINEKPEDVCDVLIDLANEAGGIDNITAVFMTRSEDFE